MGEKKQISEEIFKECLIWSLIKQTTVSISWKCEIISDKNKSWKNFMKYKNFLNCSGYALSILPVWVLKCPLVYETKGDN